jgi:UDP-N-acetylglucosamine 1-carboxyvinyltransferase
MSKIMMQGGLPLKGEFTASGNKNAAMPIIIASLLIKGTSRIENVPNTIDVMRVIKQAQGLGCNAVYEDNKLEISLNKLLETRFGNPIVLPPQLNLLFVGSLIHLSQKVIIEGLDVKKERVDTHFDVLRLFDVAIETYDEYVEFSTHSKLRGKEILLGESSVTGTELAIILAVLAEGETRIYNAACEPHIQDLIEFLNSAGAAIDGGGTNLLRITGVKSLGATEFVISEDHVEIGSLIGMVAMTKGED